MKANFSLSTAILIVSGCTTNLEQHADEFTDASFDLCGTMNQVQAFSRAESGKIRVICPENRYFLLNSTSTLVYIPDLDGVYCSGKGFNTFRERKDSFLFTCSDQSRFHIPK